jgi:hypothetical protein
MALTARCERSGVLKGRRQRTANGRETSQATLKWIVIPVNAGPNLRSVRESYSRFESSVCLVVSQTESFAGDCREPDFRCRKERKGCELPVTDWGLRVPPHAAWVWK